jgi:hypothetical protein
MTLRDAPTPPFSFYDSLMAARLLDYGPDPESRSVLRSTSIFGPVMGIKAT